MGLSEELKIVIAGDPKKFNAALDEMQARTKRLEAGLSVIAKTSGVAFAALTGTVGGLIAAFRDQEIQEKKTVALIQASGGAAGVTAAKVFQLAASYQDLTDVGDEVILSAENILLGFTKIGKDAFPQAIEQTLNLSKFLGGDLNAAALQLGKALEDPAEGLSALGRAGIKFTEEQQRMIAAMSNSGNVAGAQQIILQALEGRIGGLAKASGEGSGKIFQLKNAIGDVGEEIGRQLTPKIAAAAEVMIPFFKSMANSESFTKTAAAALIFSAAVSALVLGVSSAILGAVKFVAIVKAAAVAFAGVSAAALGWVAVIGLVIVAVVDLALNWDRCFNNMRVTLGAFILLLAGAGESVVKIFKGIFTLSLETIKDGLSQAAGLLPKFVSDWSAAMGRINAEAQKVADAEEQRLKADKDRNDRAIEQTRFFLEEKTRIIQEYKDLASEAALTDRQLQLLQEQQHNNDLLALQNQHRADSAGVERATALENQKIQNAANLQFLKDQQKFGTAYAMINKTLHSENVQSFASAASELAQLQTSSNKTLKAIGKAAAITDISIKTAQSAMNVFAGFTAAVPPPFGIALGIAGAAAAVAFGGERIGQVMKAADGGVMSGGRRGVDSIPTLTMPGELITPTRNYNEHINAVVNQRMQEQGGSPGGGGAQGVWIGLKNGAEQFFEVIETGIMRRQSQGISYLPPLGT